MTRLRVWRRSRELRPFWEGGAPATQGPRAREHLKALLAGGQQPAAEISAASRRRNRRALALYAGGDLEAAGRLLQRAVEKDADEPLLRNNLAQVLVDRARRLRHRPAERPRRSADEPTLHLLEALAHLDVAVDLAPADPVPRYHRGRVERLLADQGDLVRLPAAERDFRAALDRRPTFAEAANDLAVLLIDRGRGSDLAEALRLLERAAAFVPAHDRSSRAAILKNLGRARKAAGDPGAALAAFEIAECLAPVGRFELRAEISGRSARLLAAHWGPASGSVAWRRYAAHDRVAEDPSLRAAFERFKAGWPSVWQPPADAPPLAAWQRRCEHGHLAAAAVPRAGSGR